LTSVAAMTARPATPDDADELIRLRAVMLRSGGHRMTWNDDWREPARQSLRNRLADPSSGLAAYVVDRPGAAGPAAGLAACAVGLIEERLGNPANPLGLAGYVFNVATDPGERRRGHARACMTSLLEWFRAHGVGAVDLRASVDGEPLYEQLGFVRTVDPAMRLALG
jgi:ribosomal protein S18 acetylase RimI-like enzyme